MNFTLLFCVHHKIHMNTHNFVPFSDTLLDGKGNAFSLSTPGGGGSSQVPSLFPDSGPQPWSFPGGTLVSGSIPLLGIPQSLVPYPFRVTPGLEYPPPFWDKLCCLWYPSCGSPHEDFLVFQALVGLKLQNKCALHLNHSGSTNLIQVSYFSFFFFLNSKALFTRSVFRPVIQPVKKWVLQYPMEVFTHNVKICQKDQRYRQQKRAQKRYV